MDWGLLLMQILLLLFDSSKGERHARNVVPPRCKFLTEDPYQIYEKKCSGTYPLVAVTKYRDTLIKIGEQVSIYMPISLDIVLVVQKFSKLHSCHNLQFKDSNIFHCMDSNRNNTIILDDADMFCFPFHIQLPDDLMNECLIENKMTDEYYYLDQVVHSKRGIMHYTYSESGAQSLHFPMLHPVLLFIIVCLSVSTSSFWWRVVNFNVLSH